MSSKGRHRRLKMVTSAPEFHDISGREEYVDQGLSPASPVSFSLGGGQSAERLPSVHERPETPSYFAFPDEGRGKGQMSPMTVQNHTARRDGTSRYDRPKTPAGGQLRDNPPGRQMVRDSLGGSQVMRDNPSRSQMVRDSLGGSQVMRDNPPASQMIRDSLGGSQVMRDNLTGSQFIRDRLRSSGRNSPALRKERRTLAKAVSCPNGAGGDGEISSLSKAEITKLRQSLCSPSDATREQVSGSDTLLRTTLLRRSFAKQKGEARLPETATSEQENKFHRSYSLRTRRVKTPSKIQVRQPEPNTVGATNPGRPSAEDSTHGIRRPEPKTVGTRSPGRRSAADSGYGSESQPSPAERRAKPEPEPHSRVVLHLEEVQQKTLQVMTEDPKGNGIGANDNSARVTSWLAECNRASRSVLPPHLPTIDATAEDADDLASRDLQPVCEFSV